MLTDVPFPNVRRHRLYEERDTSKDKHPRGDAKLLKPVLRHRGESAKSAPVMRPEKFGIAIDQNLANPGDHLN